MLGCSPLIPAVLIWGIYCSVCVFSQGLQESVEGWEEEGNLVSDVHHLLCLFISPFSLLLEDTLFLHPSPLSLTCSHTPSLFLGDWISSRAGKSSDPWDRPADDGLQLALRPVPRYLRRHSANLGHVVALTLPRCQSFSLSGSSCSSTGLMRLSLANITTQHYRVAFSFHADRRTLIEEPKQCRDITLVTQKAIMTDRADVLQVWITLILNGFY